MKYLIYFLFLLTIVACTSDNEQNYFSELDCNTEDLYYQTLNPTSTSIKSIIDNKCVGCHYLDNMSQVKYVVLEEYEQIIDVDIYAAINRPPDNSMPPPGYPQLTECEKTQIENWILNNSPYDEQAR